MNNKNFATMTGDNLARRRARRPTAPMAEQGNEGVALILVLAFIVLLTGLVVAYFSRTATDRQLSDSSVNGAKTDELAKSAFDIILGDLKQEIVNGSTAKTSGACTIYVPTDNKYIVPVHNPPLTGGTSAVPNLIRTSGTSVIAFPGMDHRASASVSTGTSANGRSITLKRWNKHYLIPRVTGAAATDTTPIAAFTAPDWVYVTNQGPLQTPITSPTNSVTGRYAYAIYDEGGLLDMNLVGYPSNTTAQQAGHKGSVAFADLTVPGGPGLTQAQVDNIVGWRNYASSQPGGSFDGFTFDAGAATRYFNFVTSGTNGFLTVSGSTWQSRTDQAFLSRQQLINFAASNGFLGDALQYLGTFTRELNAPTWSPTYDAATLGGAGGSYAYKTNAENAAQSNRDLPNVRFSADATVTDYSLDGTPSTRPVKAGDPLIQRRFPLTRLSWFTSAGPSPGIPNAAAAIKQHFGLMWDSAKSQWVYTSPTGSLGSPATAIKNLAAVASQNREPDFMELLKAAILEGSLAKTAGDPSNASSDTAFRTADIDSSVDLHLIRIAANIIDQYKTDSWPTSIQFGTEVAHGIENLPYINRIFDTAYRPDDKGTRSKLCCWYEFEMWNPNQNPPASISQGPTTFRITATSGQAAASIHNNTTGQDIKAPVVTFMPGSSTVQFSYQPFNEPALLTPPAAICDTPPQSIASADTLQLAGLYTGAADITGVPDTDLGSGGSLPTLPTFELQFQNPGGAWVTYQKIPNLRDSIRGGAGASNNYFRIVSTNRGYYFRSDPRSTRFGGGKNSGCPPGQTMRGLDMTPYTNNPEGKYTADGPIAANPGWKLLRTTPNPTHARLPALASNDVYATTSYNDPDGILRIADCSGFRTAAATSPNDPLNPFATGTTAPRPVMLNRPFRSVAELGYVFRDEPWKTLDFFSPDSADSGLLDLFCIDDNAVNAGHVNLNTAQPKVLAAILAGAIRQEVNTTQISGTNSIAIAQDIVNYTSNKPLINKSELVTGFSPTTVSANYPQYKTEREAVARALSDVGSTRTWNLFIDVIAQSGKYPAGATDLDKQFVVEGEKRYWLHVAIDRFTGEIIDETLEPVYE